ncbi:putative serine/threonine-protein kinase PBL7 [Senna tora]|uniref:Putative serine/threonine-protein kinase PBL7 n=1 Tax=Senna tora TaxID=362788 RepID=A0A834WCW9_9FABA|nr:putative serine/threonine-protein kinase PBL7 [Senna tora]
MGLSRGTTCTDDSDSRDPPNAPNAPYASSSVVTDHHCDYTKHKFRTILRKMIWELGFACGAPHRRRRCSGKGKGNGQGRSDDGGNGHKKANLEHNKAWLLAEAGAELTNADPQSVHSSFRFSFCSQVELESLSMNSSTAATVLMVNLDNGVSDSRARELKWRRIESLERSISPVADTLIRFNYGEIASATRNFSKGRVLGRGALSCVFRGRVGILRSAVAIKRLDKEDKESAKAFCRELMIASSLHHQNIVPLVGFCIDPEEGLFLVYKYVSGGSLEHHLHERKKGLKGSSSLPWSVRYKVAIGIAEAVAYLHNGTERCVVHRDIKPSNILLSSRKTPKLCDFGLATWTSAPSVPFLCKTVKGTFGYLAPEYFQHGKVSDKTDVYAFGVVLLELITGRKPIEVKNPAGEENLVLWAKPLLQKGKGAIEELLDPQLKCSLRYSNQMARMIEAAAACVTNEESRRPGIHEIIAIMKGEEEPVLSKRKKASLLVNGLVIDCYSQSQLQQQTHNEMKSHLALAMLGVSEFEDDDYLYGR